MLDEAKLLLAEEGGGRASEDAKLLEVVISLYIYIHIYVYIYLYIYTHTHT